MEKENSVKKGWFLAVVLWLVKAVYKLIVVVAKFSLAVVRFFFRFAMAVIFYRHTPGL